MGCPSIVSQPVKALGSPLSSCWDVLVGNGERRTGWPTEFIRHSWLLNWKAIRGEKLWQNYAHLGVSAARNIGPCGQRKPKNCLEIIFPLFAARYFREKKHEITSKLNDFNWIGGWLDVVFRTFKPAKKSKSFVSAFAIIKTQDAPWSLGAGCRMALE